VGGCAAALLLARQGHAVTLLEQSARVGPAGAGVLLQTSGQRVLAKLGLLEAVLATSERIDELVAITHRGKPLSHLRFADLPGGLTAYGVHRGDLFTVLHTSVIAQRIDLRLNQAVGGVDCQSGLLTDSTGQEMDRFDLVVAADGSRSRLRESSGIRAFVHPYRPAALWAVVKHPAVKNQLLQRTSGTQQLCGLLPTGVDRTSFFWGVDSHDWPALAKSSFAQWQEMVGQLMPEARPVVQRLHSFDDLVFSTYRAVWMPSVVSGKLVFLGDAAHACSPLLGHGINQAMVDAMDLANAIEQSSSVDESLAQYNAMQRLRNGYYSALSALLTPTFQGRSNWIGVARDLALPRLQSIGPLRRLMLRTLVGVRPG
jgi:2-polyprenyl-6-methoxyphenol hydroxylase-like FAD-dependent oxidoreductase